MTARDIVYPLSISETFGWDWNPLIPTLSLVLPSRGMVIVQKITEDHIRSAVEQLVGTRFFDTLVPARSSGRGHRILAKIDRSNPYFSREIIRRLDGRTTNHLLEIWLAVEGEHGGWLSAVTISGLNLPDMSAMPGDHPLDALLSAVRFAKTLLDENEGTFLFGVRDHGKLPINRAVELVGAEK